MILEYTGKQLKMFDERRMDDTFYKAFLCDYRATPTKDMIMQEYDTLRAFDDFRSFKKAEKISTAGFAKGTKNGIIMDIYRTTVLEIAMYEYDKCLSNIIVSLKKNDVLEEQLKNLTNPFMRDKLDKMSALQKAQFEEAKNTNDNNKFITELYGKGILGYTLNEAFCISKALESSYKGEKGDNLDKALGKSNFIKAYEKVKDIDLTKCLNKNDIEDTIKDFKELKRSIVHLKMSISNTDELTENVKSSYTALQKRIKENEKNVFAKFKDEQLQEYENAEKVLDKESLREVFNNILVSNRVQRKLSAPFYNFTQMDFRNAKSCDKILLEAYLMKAEIGKNLTAIKDSFKDDLNTVKRAVLYRDVLSKQKGFKFSNTIFTNGLMVDEFKKRAEAYKNDSKIPFIEECGFEKAINNSFDASYRLIHRPPYNRNLTEDKEGKVRIELAKFLAKEKSKMFMQGVDISKQMIFEATNGNKEQYDKLLEASDKFSKYYVHNVLDSLHDVVIRNKIENMYDEVTNINSNAFLNNGDMKSHADALAQCERMVYGLNENQFQEFKDSLAKRNKELNLVTKQLYLSALSDNEDDTTIKDTINALIISNREHLRSLSLENKQSLFNERLYTYASQFNEDKVLSPEEYNEFLDRFKGFMDSKDTLVPAIIKEQKFADASVDLSKGNNIIAAPIQTQQEPKELEEPKEPSEDAKAKDEDKKPEAKQEAKKKLDGLKELPDYEKDMETLGKIKDKYGKADFDKDSKKFWNGFGFVACIAVGLVMLFTGAALPGLAAYALGNFAAVGIGAAYFWTKREQVVGPRRADAKQVQSIMNKYGIKTLGQRAGGFLGRFNPFKRSWEHNMIAGPDIYINDAIRKMERVKHENDLRNEVMSQGTGFESISDFAPNEEEKGDDDRTKEAENTKQEVKEESKEKTAEESKETQKTETQEQEEQVKPKEEAQKPEVEESKEQVQEAENAEAKEQQTNEQEEQQQAQEQQAKEEKAQEEEKQKAEEQAKQEEQKQETEKQESEKKETEQTQKPKTKDSFTPPIPPRENNNENGRTR